MVRSRLIAFVVSAAVAVSGLGLFAAPAQAATTLYSQTETIPVPPAASYSGSAGGDGWDVALSDDRVYNVFHHSSVTTVACHLQKDASSCWSPKTITDESGSSFGAGAQSAVVLSTDHSKLYSFAVRSKDGTAGVLCVDVSKQADATRNPFCGYTALTQAGTASDWPNLGSPMKAGNRWYLYLYVNGRAVNEASGANRLLCFDLAAGAACAQNPIEVPFVGSTVSISGRPPPGGAAIGSKLVVSAQTADGAQQLACIDSATNGPCAGSWPVRLPSHYVSTYGVPFPLVSAQSEIVGVCLPTGANPCWSLTGESVPTPAGMNAALRNNIGWNGPAVVKGWRVYLPNMATNQVMCFDAVAQGSCRDFPLSFSGANGIYTVNADPQRPACLWINADNGGGQLQTFDAFTGKSCGTGPMRVLASSFVVDSQVCRPATYRRLTLMNPTPAEYSSASVSFHDGAGQPLPGLADVPLDEDGSIDLSDLDLEATLGLPQFLFTIAAGDGARSNVTVRLDWSASDDPTCDDGSAIRGHIVAEAGGPYAAPEGGAVRLTGAGYPDAAAGEITSYRWDLDDDGQFETEGATPTFTASGIDGPSQHFVTLRACTATMVCADDRAEVAVVNRAPEVDAGPDRTVRAGQATALSGSFADPAGTDDAPYATSWTGGAGTPTTGSAQAPGTVNASVTYKDAGRYPTTLTVTDADGAAGSDEAVVSVLPVDPDCRAATASTGNIWPPNHKWVDVAVTGVTAPTGTGTPAIRVVGVRQDEPVEAAGDGSTGPDARVTASGVQVLAERSGTGDGRVYTILFEATTTAGGRCQGQVSVSVPHAQKKPAVDSGAWFDSLAGTGQVPGTAAALPDWYRTATGQKLAVPARGVLGNDLVPAGQSPIVEVLTQPSTGQVTLSRDGSFTFTPTTGGRVTFDYRVRTAAGWSAPATVTIDVDAATQPVHAPSRQVVTGEDTPATITLGATTLPAGAVTSFAIGRQPGHGTAVLDGAKLTYTPHENVTGTDEFTYKATAGGVTVEAPISVSVLAANDTPTVGKPTPITTAEDTPATLTLDAGALGVDVDSPALTVVAASAGTHGVTTLVDNRLTYTPAKNYTGLDSITVTVADASDARVLVKVPVTVTEVNDPPTAGAYSTTVGWDRPTRIATTDLLAAATAGPKNEAGQELRVAQVEATDALHGTVAIDGDAVVFTPDGNVAGAATFRFQVCDDRSTAGAADAQCAWGTATITVTKTNRVPVPTTGPAQTREDSAVPVTLTGTDRDGDALTFTVTTPPAHGSFAGSAPALTYTPAAEYHGQDSFSYNVSDGKTTSAPATVTITVAEVNDAPVPGQDAFRVDPGARLQVPVAELLVNDRPGPADEAAQTLTVTAVTASATTHGTLTLADGVVSYAPEPGYQGLASGTYRVCDSGTAPAAADVECATGVVSFTVAREGDPVPVDDVTTVAEDGHVSVAVTDNDTHPAGLPYQVSAVGSAGHGTVEVLMGGPNAGQVRYSPAPDYVGPDRFTYEVTDAVGRTGMAAVTVTVTEMNDAPVPDSDQVNGTWAAPFDIPVSVLLDGDTPGPADEASQHLSVVSVRAGPDAHGSVRLDPARGVVVFTPDGLHDGATEFTYEVCDDGTTAGAADPQCATGTVTVQLDRANRAPTALNAVVAVTADTTEQLTVPAADPDGDALTLTVTGGPAHGTATVTGSGTIAYTPAVGYTGVDELTYTVSDPAGLTATGTLTLTVAEAAATRLAIAPTTITLHPGETHRFTVTATNADGVPAETTGTVWASSTPAVATIDSRGVVTARADGQDRISATLAGRTVTATLTVASSPWADLAVTATTPALAVGNTTTVAAVATRADGTGATVTPDTLWTISAGPGTVTRDGVVTATGPGRIVVTGNYHGITGTTQITAAAVATGDSTDPTGVVVAPTDGAVITAPTTVLGTVADANLLRWATTLTEIGAGGQPIVVATGTTPVAGGTLGTLDPTLLGNGQYTLRIEVTDTAGHVTTTDRTVIIEGANKPGAFGLSFQDLQVPVSGVPVTLTRSYDTRTAASAGDFGYGWDLSLSSVKAQVTPAASTGWASTKTGGAFGSFTVAPTRPHEVSLALPGGRVERFTMGLTPSSQPLVAFQWARVGFTSTSGTRGTLTALDNTDVYLDGAQPGPVQLLDDTEMTPFAPTRFRYTSVDGAQFVVTTTGLESITDPHGTTLQVTATGVTSTRADGTVQAAISIDRDQAGRITGVTSPGGASVAYTYDTNGDLATSTDPDGHTTRYRYTPGHLLLEVIDPLGTRATRSDYDDTGRLVAVTDATGHTTHVRTDLAANTQIVTDRLGHTRTYVTDDRGNITRETGPDGAITTRTFDAADQVWSITDPLGHTTSYTYDSTGNRLTSTDPNGITTTRTYTPTGQVTSESVAGQPGPSWTYTPAGDMLTAADATGATWTMTSTNGLRASSTDPAGNITRYAYDQAGRPVQVTGPDGAVTTAIYDGDGHRLSSTATRTDGTGTARAVTTVWSYTPSGKVASITDPLGRVTRTRYTPAGQVAATVDAAGHTSSTTYTDLGLVETVSDPTGAVTRFGYDPEGRRTSSTDPDGHTATTTYDAAGRVVATTAADGTVSRIGYDLAGRQTSSTDPGGARTSVALDPGGRVITSTDPTGALTRTEYDDHDRITATIDPAGARTSNGYDAAGRQARVTTADGAVTTTTYTTLGQRASVTAPDGAVTTFGYSPTGRLVSVSDALGNLTRYTWDEVGNHTSTTDANGHLTRFGYDDAGQRLTLTKPDGATQTTWYDTAGNLSRVVDFAGQATTYAYDAAGRQVSSTDADSVTFTRTWTATGRPATVTDPHGTTSYEYTATGLRAAADTPNGRVTYHYDPTGRLTELTSPYGSTGYGYDQAGRTTSITTDAGDHTYTYTEGRLGSLTQPNGITTTYGYTTAGYLTRVNATSPDGHTLLDQRLTRTPDGQIDTITETGRVGATGQTGTATSTYTHDPLDRLTSATLTRTGGPDLTLTYGYDHVGNRISDTVNGRTTTSTFDVNDQLLTRGTTTYTYDGNGNQTHASDPTTGTITYAYNARGRLTAATTGTGTSTQYDYDADNNLISTRTGIGTTTHLLDTNRDLPQIIADHTSTGTTTTYTFDHRNHLLEHATTTSTSPTQTQYATTDYLGSVRATTTQAGHLTSTTAYDPYGTPLQPTTSTYTYNSQKYDPTTNAYYLRARWYTPTTARFTTTDPHEGSLVAPETQPDFTYASNSPLWHIDPTGESTGLLGEQVSISSVVSSLVNLAGAGAIITLPFLSVVHELEPIGDSGNEPRPSETLDEDNPSGSATVFLDRDKRHASIETVYRGHKLHTHQWNPFSDLVRGYPYSEDEFGKLIIPIRFDPLPNARKAQAFQMATMGVNLDFSTPEYSDKLEFSFGPYDERSQSCVTYVVDVLRAGGEPAPFGDTLTLTRWLFSRN